MESYLKNVAPYPVSLDYYIDIEDKGREHIELELRKPGYVGARKGDTNLLNKFGLRHFCRSYFEWVSPRHIDFVFNGVEIHLRTPGVEEFSEKNIARNIFNPTVEKVSSKKKN